MKFIRVEGTVELEHALISELDLALSQNKPVLWLLTGGSNIAVETRVMAALAPTNFANLTMVLTDERHGEPGHADSNFFQLQQAGFNTRGAIFKDILTPGATLVDCAEAAGLVMKKAFSGAGEVIGFFGMGADGHIAGILPNSPAAVRDEKWMIGYDGGQFRRITLTPFALSHVQTAYVGAFGPEKLTALETLQHTMLPMPEQPAQILRSLPTVYIYNNQIGDES